jgi:hypothetical protein
MKKTLTTLMFALVAGTAAAQPFAYQSQIGSEEYVPGYDTKHMNFAAVERSDQVSAYDRWVLEANLDGIAPNAFAGTIVKAGPTQISLYEIQRGSPEATGNALYYAQFPANTDWDRVAAEFRASQIEQSLASEPTHGEPRS